MEWGWLIVIIAAGTGLIIWTVIQNERDRKDLVHWLNRDEHPKAGQEGDIETGEILH